MTISKTEKVGLVINNIVMLFLIIITANTLIPASLHLSTVIWLNFWSGGVTIKTSTFCAITLSSATVYLPHFVSWMIISGILFALLSPTSGIVREAANLFNYQGTIPNLLMSKEYFRVLLVASNIWKEAGFGTVLYLATIVSIDPQLYEAAIIDGAGKLKQIWHITLPGLRTTIIILLIFRMGQLLNAGMDQIFAMYNPSVYEVSEILDTYIYKIGISEGNFKIATTMGIFKSCIGLVLVLLTNYIAKKVDRDSGLI